MLLIVGEEAGAPLLVSAKAPDADSREIQKTNSHFRTTAENDVSDDPNAILPPKMTRRARLNRQ